MFSTPEQLSAAAKTTMESQLTVLGSLARQTFAGFEKLIELNLNVAKTSLQESTAAYGQLFASNDPQTFFGSSASMTPPSAERALSYAQQVAGIATEIQAEFSKAAESQVADAKRTFAAMMEEAGKNAPAGSENAIAMLRSMMTKATEGYEQVTHTTRQAVESMKSTMESTIESNLVTTVEQMAPPAPAKTTKAGKK